MCSYNGVMPRTKITVGQTFHRLTVLERLPNKYIGKENRVVANWLCQCQCKRKVEKTTSALRNSKSCGCLQKETARNRVQKIYPKQKFGFLTVIRFQKDKGGSSAWECECFCGNTVIIRSSSLTKRRTKSCGCLASTIRNETFYQNHPFDPIKVKLREIYLVHKAGAKKKRIRFSLSENEVSKLVQAPCHHCGLEPDTMKINGVDLIDPPKGYVLENCMSCCNQCNHAKGNWSLKEFEMWLARVLIYKKQSDKVNHAR